MYYEKELYYFLKTLNRMYLQSVWIESGTDPCNKMNFSLYHFYGRENAVNEVFCCPNHWAKENTVYKLTDEFLCNYIYFLLPETTKPAAILAGPYLSFHKSREALLEEAERFNIPISRISQLEACYSEIPVFPDDTQIFIMINVLAETLWGKNNAYEIIDMNQDFSASSGSYTADTGPDTPSNLLLRMRALESRYAYENELMELISLGLSRRAELMLRGFSTQVVEQRTADPVRNLKNYAIITNTLARKAAERGGVHPVYLDRTSSSFARRIETITDFSDGASLMLDMIHSYCRLVRKHSANQYSPFIQKTVAYIDANLAGDLSLPTLAALQNLNASYLSALFHKETGKTVTDYVTSQRMDTAGKLLRTTQLQIQTVAQHCGINDSNYFSKLFKKHYGISPLQFREHTRPSLPGRNSSEKT